jgi:hypothetical protein
MRVQVPSSAPQEKENKMPPKKAVQEPRESSPTTPGWKTSEFYMTLVTQIVGILALTGILTPEDSRVVVEHGNRLIEGVFGLFASAVPAAAYIYGRAKVKSRE